ncbi:NAD(P)/FAD-dependent oxidoreductase [Halomonas sp. HNIBRBA4712]|uniref:NAD(P)/FAD-dependent oxidoreductase n=1 Tax=Halomonas sp. HNIBRBA4712 TaxID=3373087 RepID=UPI003746523D
MFETTHRGRRPERVAVIGAGIAGLACAQALAHQGVHVALFDKARGPGGRMASKRRPGAVFDLGAQTFTARDARFQALVASLEQEGVIARWPSVSYRVNDDGGWTPLADGKPRYAGAPRMSAITFALSDRLTRSGHVTSRFETRIRALQKSPGDKQVWRLVSDTGEVFGPFDTVVITAPPPQAQTLLDEWDTALANACAEKPQRSCWVAWVRFETPLPALDGIARWETLHAHHPALRLVSRNQTKPGREAQPESLSLLAQLDWSDAYLERPPEEAACALYAAFRSRLPAGITLPNITDLGAHRWRYAQTKEPSRESYLYSAQGLALCGESFRGSRVEDAWLSGHELGKALVALPTGYRNKTPV